MVEINVKLAIILVAAALMLIAGNAAVDQKNQPPSNPSCIKNCLGKCRSAPIPNECLRDCYPTCYPPSKVHFSDCKINCEKSACSKFASDDEKLKVCKVFCWQNCNA